ncbi:MAG: protein kinase [Candidatus Acidiferrales bacterium]
MEMLGKYRIEAKLGQGAMGCVYKAWHPGFHDYVALKTIQDTRLEGSQLLERFRREGQALAKLKHQNIVQIYDADQADGIHFIVMEYMNGGSLDRIIEKRDRSLLARRVGCVVPACQALSYAHRRGLFHRDIKPANIMLHNDGNDEILKVVDFGIARLVDLSATQDFSISHTSVLIGSPAYMAPELLTGTERANERTDIWALGVTLYELVAFERPFQGKDLDELRRNVIHARPKSLRQLAPECPSDLDAVVQRMIDKEVSRRYPTVEDLLIDLEPIAKRMRSEAAVSLVHRANDLCDIGEIENAKAVLTEARRYDSTNTQLRDLLQKVDRELQRREVLPRLHTHLKRARDFVRMEEYQNAREEISSALSLDATFEPARKYLEEIEGEAKKKEAVQEKLRLIKQRIAEGELTQAEMFLKEIEEIDGGNTQSMELRREIEQEKQHRLKRKRINEIVSRAGVLMAALQEEQCLILLSQGLQEYPEEPELLRLQEIVRNEAAEALRQQERQRRVEEIRGLAAKGNFDGAQNRMQQLLQEFPNDAVVKNVRSFLTEEIKKDQRRAKLRAGVDEVRSLLAGGSAEAANAALQKLLAEFSGEPEVRDLQDSVNLETEKQRKKQTAAQGENDSIEAETRTIRKKIRSKKYADAVTAAQKLILRFPADAGARAVRDEATIALPKRQMQEMIRTKTREIRQKINKEQYEEAVGEATRTLDQWGPQQEIEALLRAADVELREQRARTEAQEHRLAETRALLADGKKDEALQLAQDAIDTRVFRNNDPRVVALMNDIQSWKSLGNEPLTPAVGGKAATSDEPPQAESSQRSTRSNETQIGVVSDCQGAVQPQENECFASNQAPLTEGSIELPTFRAGEKSQSRDVQDTTSALDGDFSKPTCYVRKIRAKARLVAVLAGSVVIAGLGFFVIERITSETAKKETVAFRRATEDEHEKRWSTAAAEYKAVAAGKGAVAAQAGKELSRLSALLEKESGLKQGIEQARMANSYDQAEILLTQLANLHGDMEEAALSEKNEVEQEAQLQATVLRAKDEKAELEPEAGPADKGNTKKFAMTKPGVPAQKDSSCQLSASDLPVRLNRANRNSALGDYDSAEREYIAVLACQPNNEQARVGLERTRKAKNM